MLEIKQLEIEHFRGVMMDKKYNRRESWEIENFGGPIKCVLDVSKNLRHYFDYEMSETGLTGIQMRLLGYIRMEEEKGHNVFQRDIEGILRIKRSSVTSLLQTLEKKNYIVRKNVEGDARIKKLTLTDEARRIQMESFQIMTRLEKQTRALFTEEEFQRFLEYMSRIDRMAMEQYHSKEETYD